MKQPAHRTLKALAVATVAAFLLPASAFCKDKSKFPAVRWVEGNPGCTFSRGDDGKYRYGLWTDDVGIVMAVDSQELEKVHRRHQLFFALLLTVRYQGQGALDVGTENISLQFMKHFQVMQTAIDPDDFSDKVQSDADTLNDETARQVEKHPEQKEQKEALVRAFLKDSDTHTVCPWKGTASYYDVVVDGKVNKDAAWTYPETKDAAQHVRGYVAFWKGVTVEK